jgi:hypothetical protein
MSPLQLLGLAIILISVLLINLAKYRASSAVSRSKQEEKLPVVPVRDSRKEGGREVPSPKVLGR